MTPRPSSSTLFPNTTLFRSRYGAGPVRTGRAAGGGIGAGDLPGGLFFAAPQPDDGEHAAGGSAARRGCVGGTVCRVGRAAADQLRADLRESGRDDGSEQSASPLPDLVQPRGAERGG